MPAPLQPPQDEQPPQAQQAQQAEIPTEIIPPAPTAPSTVPTPEATSYAPPTTPEAPLFVPATSAPPPLESSITISSSKFKGLCHTLQTLSTTQGVLFQQMLVIRAHQDQRITMQTQHTAILGQIQQHLGILLLQLSKLFYLRRLLQQSKLCLMRRLLQQRSRLLSRALRRPQQSHRLHMILPPLPDHLSTFYIYLLFQNC